MEKLQLIYRKKREEGKKGINRLLSLQKYQHTRFYFETGRVFYLGLMCRQMASLF
jgi:hypothetical protein